MLRTAGLIFGHLYQFSWSVTGQERKRKIQISWKNSWFFHFFNFEHLKFSYLKNFKNTQKRSETPEKKEASSFGNLEKNIGGFDEINEGDILKLYLQNSAIYVEVKGKNEFGFNGIFYARHPTTGTIVEREGWTSRVGIDQGTYLKVPKEEVQSLMDEHRAINFYDSEYIRIEGGNGPHLGKVYEIHDDGVFLCPYVHYDLIDQEMVIREEARYFVRNDQLGNIVPSSREELEAYVKRTNEKKDKDEDKSPEKD